MNLLGESPPLIPLCLAGHCPLTSPGVRGQHEGLVHISQLRQEGRVKDVNDVVKRGQKVKVKVLGITGHKMSLSMKVCM